MYLKLISSRENAKYKKGVRKKLYTIYIQYGLYLNYSKVAVYRI